MKSPRLELVVMVAMLLLAMAGFWWMQHRDPKVTPAKPGAVTETLAPIAPAQKKAAEPSPVPPK